MTENNNPIVTPEPQKPETTQENAEQTVVERTAPEQAAAEQPVAEPTVEAPAAEPVAEPVTAPVAEPAAAPASPPQPVEAPVQNTAPAAAPAQSTANVPHLTFENELPPIPELEVPNFSAEQTQSQPQQPQPAPAQAPTGQPTHTVPQYGAQYQQNQGQYQQPQYQPPVNNYQKTYRPVYDVPPEGYVQKSRLAAAVLAFQFGVFGVHNFYLGNSGKAIIQLILTILGLFIYIPLIVTAIWAFVEGIMIISSQNPLYDANGVIMKE